MIKCVLKLFPGPMTDNDEGRDPAAAERCRRVLDETRVEIFPGPMTDSNEGRDPATAERYRRVLDETRVAVELGERSCVIIFGIGVEASDVVHCPAFNSQ